ncbi:hypothetical protein FQB35_15085 [Crassaminicella thermophila]|uniref:Uncharacterized protein n=1 Tax=Crassaminicella thermophila TaxID=2599308 RepID=A0A5C0SKN0_CRATE|nr:hypothetical protein [Crassaminicella thermophila]QEK13479.1 hypothetical protein FQB35_15085 [Crassaminicella thermophila]
MDKYLFKQVEIEKQFILFFLCGTHFNRNNKRDKRTVLKRYLESIDSRNRAIILEENFIFREKSTKKYLAYDEIFLKNLFDVELLASLLADKIFIIHESISTAAELGLFASNEEITKKICLLVPDKYNVEEKKLSKFIELAFLKRKPSIHTIYYYPIVKENKISLTKSDYHTYFYNDKIGKNLSNNIKRFIDNDSNKTVDLHIKESKFNGHIKDYLTYHVNKKNKKINIYLPIEVIKSQIISLFNIKEFTRKLRSIDNIKDVVNEVQKLYEDILSNTIGELKGLIIDEYKLYYNVINESQPKLRLRQTIGYILYILQAMDMIELPSVGEKLTIKTSFKLLYQEYEKCIEKSKLKEFSFLGR